MPTDKRQVEEAKAILLDDPELNELLEENKISEGRPINDLEKMVDPGDKVKHPYYLQPWFRIGSIAIPLIIMGFVGYKIWGPKPQKVMALGDKDKQIIELTEKLQQSELEKAQLTQDNMGLTQAAELEPFKQQQKQLKQQQLKQQAQKQQAKQKKPVPVRGKPIQRQNTVSIPRRLYRNPTPKRSYTPAKPSPSLLANSKPSGPSLSECVGYVERNINVPGCNRYQISQKPQSSSQTASIGKNPTIPRPAYTPRPQTKPVKLAFASQSKAKPRTKVKPDYQVNFMAGEIQTVDQFEAEFYGAGQSAAAPTRTSMKAKVIDHVEWISPQEAQQMVIPLKITSGPHKGQTAEAKIQQMNGLQFTAYVTRINGQEIEPGTMEVRRKNTKYLRSQLKRQGGESFGDRVMGTVAAIGGEIATDQLADVRGGNHISRLVSNPQRRTREVTQYWRFDGEVELVPVG
ncbi:hypothetical protein [Acaryochloris marina]|uniref:Uncharacterized protein n=1 Tax=Acaryochloris marina (strain MBIC 11017) TaxID=329726 RepID=A8ZQG1_ACAM1|nr:hypothetical protein [Acaryochloris marina]ABW33247.1 hypothetical protein AM1_G0067 [Acaryochloris marina MBIC11017]